MNPLRRHLIRLAYTTPALRPQIVPLLKTAASEGETFEDSVKGKTFVHPTTHNRVQYKSLPPESQKRIREHFEQAKKHGTEEDKGYGHSEHLKDYNLSIVGDNKERAVYISKKMQEGIHKTEDICKLSPPVCEGNLGISRDNMPQVMDKSVPELLASKDEAEQKKGKAAVDAGADPKDKRPIMNQLLDSFKKKGVKVEKKKIAVGNLKATQKEIKAGKTFGMADSYFKGKFDPAADTEIVVSSDGHILDGHHRWAALLVSDPDRKMSCIQVDIPMREFLKKSLDFPGVFRADLQDNVISKDTPLDLNESKKKTALFYF